MSVLEQLAAKAQVTGDVGENLDKELTAAEAEAHAYMGGSKWLKEGTKGVSSLADHIRKDFEEGKFDALDGKQIHDLLLDYNRKACECMLNLSELKKAEALVANGRVVGLKNALEVVKRHHTTATVRAEQLLQAIASEEQPMDEEAARAARRERAPGEHPGPSSLDARRQEALQAGKSTKKTKRTKKSRLEETPAQKVEPPADP